MKTQIQLIHPAGKKAVTMEAGKYSLMMKAILAVLAKGGSTHSEMLQAVTDDLASNGEEFPGSIEWHMEWVKLDLEARKQIRRTTSSPVRLALFQAQA
jgi:hypothetical protein